MVQVDHDEEVGPLLGMYGTMDAELEVQRAMKRAELTTFLCLLRKAIGPKMVHVDNKGIIDGLWEGEMRCIAPRAKDADLWTLIWEELQRFHQEGILVEVEAHRTKKEIMSLFERCIAEGNENADEHAKEGSMLDGHMAQVRASTVQQEEKKFMQPCNLQLASSVWWLNGRIVKNSSLSQKRSGPS